MAHSAISRCGCSGSEPSDFLYIQNIFVEGRFDSMTKQNAIRRRGTAILAAAFSLAMVGTFASAVIPESPLVPAASAQDQPIYSPGKASEKGTISGSVKELVKAGVNFGAVQDAGRPIKGVKVYAQWYEGEQTQHSSPVYYTESDANGNFTIKMGPYTDALGVTRTFVADASVGLTTGDPAGQRDQRREKIRMWTELPDNLTDKYRLVHQPAAGIFPGIGAETTPTTQGDGQWGGQQSLGCDHRVRAEGQTAAAPSGKQVGRECWKVQ